MIPIVFGCKPKKVLDNYTYDYYQNGQVSDKYMLRNGLLEDTSFVYFPNGVLKSKMTWKRNKLNGVSIFYNVSGKVETEGCYKDSLKTGEWFYYDSLGHLKHNNKYIIINNKSFENQFVYHKDSLTYALRCFDYDVIPKMNSIIGVDTIWDFHVYVKCHILDKVRVIYGIWNKQVRVDTIYSADGHYIIPKINCNKTPNLIGQVQCYQKTTLPNGEAGTDIVDGGYFFLNPNPNLSR